MNKPNKISTPPKLETVKDEADNRQETTMKVEEATYLNKLIELHNGSTGDVSELLGYVRGAVGNAMTKDKIALRMETASRFAYENAKFQLKASSRFFVVEAGDNLSEHLIPWVQDNGGKIREVDVIAAESE